MPCRYDVLVVGSGILGMSTAYHLKQLKPDLKVLVVDQHSRGSMGNTSKSAALFRNVFSSPMNRLLASASISFYRHLQKDMGVDLGLRFMGYLWLCDESLWKHFQVMRLKEKALEESKTLPELRIELNDVTLETLKELFRCEPKPDSVSTGGSTEIRLPEIEHGILAPAAGTLSPAKLFSFYEKKFKEAGGEIVYRTKVEELTYHRPVEKKPGAENEADSVQPEYGIENNYCFDGVRASDGVIKADKIVLATGTWTNFLTDPLGIDVHIKPKTRQLFNIAIPKNEHPMGYANKEERFPVFILPPDGIFIKPLRMRGNYIVGWADDFGRPFVFEDEPKPEQEFFNNYIHPVLTAYFPWLKNAEVKHSWAGQYHYNTLDGNPFIFNVRNLTVVAGASGSGIMKAEAIGKITASKTLGMDKPELLKDAEFPVDSLGIKHRVVIKETMII